MVLEWAVNSVGGELLMVYLTLFAPNELFLVVKQKVYGCGSRDLMGHSGPADLITDRFLKLLHLSPFQ